MWPGPFQPFPLPEKFVKFTTAELEKKTRKGKSTPRHPFFDLCAMKCRRQQAALQEEMDRHLLFLKGEIFRCLQQGAAGPETEAEHPVLR